MAGALEATKIERQDATRETVLNDQAFDLLKRGAEGEKRAQNATTALPVVEMFDSGEKKGSKGEGAAEGKQEAPIPPGLEKLYTEMALKYQHNGMTDENAAIEYYRKSCERAGQKPDPMAERVLHKVYQQSSNEAPASKPNHI